MNDPKASPIPAATAADKLTFGIDKAYDSISEEVARHKQLDGFLPAAESQFAAVAIELVQKAGVASVVAAARRKGATAIDKGDVDVAYDEVSGRKAERQAWSLCLVGIAAGAAAAAAVALMLTPPAAYGWLWWLVSVVGRPGDGVRGRYGGVGRVVERAGFRVSVGARDRDRQPVGWLLACCPG